MAFSGAGLGEHDALAAADSRLGPPRIRHGTIARPALLERLRPAPPANVVLVVAPAGYGKTTLLADLFWHPSPEPVAWLSVDERDNDPVAFLTSLALALNRIGACDRQLLQALARPRSSLASVLDRLVRSLGAAGPFLLIVDDLHLLTAKESLGIVRGLVERLPPRGRLVLASRTKPPFPVAQHRSKGRLLELGIDDLRLSEEETRLLLRRTGISVPDEDVAEIAVRTEGWPAGVYLAALAAQAARQPGSLTAFHGSDRFVSEYVQAEHLAYLPDEDVDFMLRASVLDRMSGPICDAVLRRLGSAEALERLARTNLFLIPLSNGSPRSYRFQRLFREALRAELDRTRPSVAWTLIARASAWCEAHGDTQSAIEYARAAGERDRFASLLETNALPLYYAGRLATVEHWLDQLDASELERHPALAAVGALVYGLEGKQARAEQWAAVAERAPADTTMPDGSPLEAWTAMLRAAMCGSGVEQMRRDAELSFATLAPKSLWHPAALLLLGIAHALAGETRPADALLVQAHGSATCRDATKTAACALAERSLLAGAAGRWDDAETLVVEARDTLREAHLDDYSTGALVYAASAHAAVHHGNWVRARADLDRVDRLLPALTGAFPWLSAQVRLEAARARIGLGDPDAAAALVAGLRGATCDLGTLTREADALGEELVQRTRPAGGGWEQLTPAERRLLPLLTTHLTFREIAEHLNVSRNTVKTQAICTYRKLGASSRSEAIQRAVELGLVTRSNVLETSQR
jgi:LuxR family transcriptional regulator, maltose regulon positive regulatory protein